MSVSKIIIENRLMAESLASARKKYGKELADLVSEYDPSKTFKYTE